MYGFAVNLAVKGIHEEDMEKTGDEQDNHLLTAVADAGKLCSRKRGIQGL